MGDDHGEWGGGLEVAADDVLLQGETLRRIESGTVRIRRPAIFASSAYVPVVGEEMIVPSGKWDWKAMLVELSVFLHEHGKPRMKKELIDAMEEWFRDRSPTGDAPDEASFRRNGVDAVWERWTRWEQEENDAA